MKSLNHRYTLSYLGSLQQKLTQKVRRTEIPLNRSPQNRKRKCQEQSSKTA